MALRPAAGRAVWARSPAQGDPDPERPLAPGLHDPAGRLARGWRRRRPSSSGRGVQQLDQSVELLFDLLADVEAPGDVHGRLGKTCGQVEHDGQPSLHVAGPHAVEDVALEPRFLVAPDRRHRVEMAGQQDPAPGRARCGRSRCPRPAPPPATGSAQGGFHGIGHLRLVMADRRNGDQRRWPARTVRRACRRSRRDAVLAEDVVQPCLVVALPLGKPLDHQHAGEEELAPRVVPAPRRLHGHDQAGRAPAQLVTGLGVDDRDRRGSGWCPRPAPSPARPAPPG